MTRVCVQGLGFKGTCLWLRPKSQSTIPSWSFLQVVGLREVDPTQLFNDVFFPFLSQYLASLLSVSFSDVSATIPFHYPPLQLPPPSPLPSFLHPYTLCPKALGKLVDSVRATHAHNDFWPVVPVTTDAASSIQTFQRSERIKIEGEQVEWLSL